MSHLLNSEQVLAAAFFERSARSHLKSGLGVLIAALVSVGCSNIPSGGSTETNQSSKNRNSTNNQQPEIPEFPTSPDPLTPTIPLPVELTAQERLVVPLYTEVLARGSATNIDQAGLQFWLTRLSTESCQTVALGFIESVEFAAVQSSRSHAEFVASAYRGFLGREAEAAGQQHWQYVLSSGQANRNQVARSFVASPEFASRCSALGLTSGQ